MKVKNKVYPWFPSAMSGIWEVIIKGYFLLNRSMVEFRKGRGTRDQIANICWIMEKARVFQKNIYFCFIDYAKAFTV